MLSMGMQMEWCCVHFAGGDGCLYGDEGGDEDSRAAEDREDVRTTLMLRAYLDRLNTDDREYEDGILTQHRNKQNFCHQM